ncbi:syntaxin 6 [Nannochloropsis gaditana]|uniref:Syntaxin 6 n=1 Tax=Nannochloropsis gaditana TaxID=72520 RepID=W7TST4_9STRA|nr:syntaxin 6 [Nannochloropsis gaditana]
MAQDPFFAAREELRNRVDYIQTQHENFLRLLQTTNTAPDLSCRDLRDSLCREIEAAENQCRELEKVVAVVEKNRQRFRHIDNHEIGQRRAFVTKMKQSLVKIWNNLESDYVKNKMSGDRRDVSMSVWAYLQRIAKTGKTLLLSRITSSPVGHSMKARRVTGLEGAVSGRTTTLRSSARGNT